jgi:hypothetical protein
MPFRFRRSIRVLPGPRLNIGSGDFRRRSAAAELTSPSAMALVRKAVGPPCTGLRRPKSMQGAEHTERNILKRITIRRHA